MIRRRFGAHLHTADGLRYAAVSARALGVEAMQVMVGEGFSWQPYKMADNVLNEFRKVSYGVAVYVHLPYTINPCVSKGHQHFSIQKGVMRRYLDVCEAVGATAAVLHPGYKKELTENEAKSNFLKFMEDLIPHMEGTRLLFETDSGSKNGSKIKSAEFIKDTLKILPRSHFKICINTEHLFTKDTNL
jgi:endonuclease IV